MPWIWWHHHTHRSFLFRREIIQISYSFFSLQISSICKVSYQKPADENSLIICDIYQLVKSHCMQSQKALLCFQGYHCWELKALYQVRSILFKNLFFQRATMSAWTCQFCENVMKCLDRKRLFPKWNQSGVMIISRALYRDTGEKNGLFEITIILL